MNKELKNIIVTVVFVALLVVFFGSMILAVLFPVASPESKAALYCGLFSFMACFGSLSFLD